MVANSGFQWFKQNMLNGSLSGLASGSGHKGSRRSGGLIHSLVVTSKTLLVLEVL